jgi:hypothetical protein
MIDQNTSLVASLLLFCGTTKINLKKHTDLQNFVELSGGSPSPVVLVTKINRASEKVSTFFEKSSRVKGLDVVYPLEEASCEM